MFVSDGGGKGKRESNFELNLVPFIDLMSTCISFLLITAVWTQVSMIQIGSSIYAKKTSENTEPQPREQIPLRVDVTNKGYVITAGQGSFTIPKNGADYDQPALIEQLKGFKGKYPEKVDGMISVLDDLKYDELIKGMDAMMLAGFPQISIATEGVQ